MRRTEPGSVEKSSLDNYFNPYYSQTISPVPFRSRGTSEPRSHAPHTRKITNSGRFPVWPAESSAIKGAREESGLGKDRVANLLQGLSQYIEMTDPEIAVGHETNREYERPTSTAKSSLNYIGMFHETHPPPSFTTLNDNVDDIAESRMYRVGNHLWEPPKTAPISRRPSLVEPGVEPRASRRIHESNLSHLTSTGRVRREAKGNPQHGCVFCGKVTSATLYLNPKLPLTCIRFTLVVNT